MPIPGRNANACPEPGPLRIYVCRQCPEQSPCVMAQPKLVPAACPFGASWAEWEIVWSEDSAEIAEKMSEAKSGLIKIAGKLAKGAYMQPTDYEDWGWTKGMQRTNWLKVLDAAEKTNEWCRRMAIAARQVADKI